MFILDAVTIYLKGIAHPKMKKIIIVFFQYLCSHHII